MNIGLATMTHTQNNSDKGPIAYSPTAVARKLGVSAQMVLIWIRTGELRALNVGKPHSKRATYRILKADLDKFIESRMRKPE